MFFGVFIVAVCLLILFSINFALFYFTESARLHVKIRSISIFQLKHTKQHIKQEQSS